MVGNKRHAGGMKSAMNSLKKVTARIAEDDKRSQLTKTIDSHPDDCEGCDLCSAKRKTPLAVIVHPDGTTEERDITRHGDLKTLQKIVGGWIGPITVKFRDRFCDAFCNEYGKRSGLPANLAATVYYQAMYPGQPVAPIFGTVIIFPKSQKLQEHVL